jgi:hypothetical protein
MRPEVNMPVGDGSFGKVMTVAFQCVVKSNRARVALSICCRSLAGGFIPVGEQVRYDGANFRKGKAYGPEKVVVAG